ncbi:MAG: hypothetical protein CK541_03830 [Opitutia bacterium]|nr:hypothetical protein [Opitutales bacterium]PHX79681.1 MAG: hypothetical protein CK541_03830 [Opitutae bacterium]
MSTGGKGWLGSIAVHLGLLGAIVGLSWYASRQTGESIEPVDPGLVIDLNGIPGKRPGQIGKTAGVAQGSESGSTSAVPRIHLNNLDVRKILSEREAAERAAQSPLSSPKSMVKAASKTGPTSSAKKVTLAEFKQSSGAKSGSSKTGSPAKVGGIGGVSVKKGRADGKGDNGGEGGSASAQALYAGEVQARLRTAWNQLLLAEGAAIASAGSCGVTVAIDASGFVSFSGWITRPGDASMAELVQRACAMIGNCGKPPSGKAFKIDFTKVSASDG